MEFTSKIFKFLYVSLVKRILFLIDAETVHNIVIRIGVFLGKFKLTRRTIKFCFSYNHPSLKQNIFGLEFNNPIGLGAGFDKNGYLIEILPSVGFGFMEVGSVTGEMCKGNSRPRLWRLPKDNSLCVHYGLANKGCEILKKRLEGKKYFIPLGINIAKTNDPGTDSIEAGIKDYLKVYNSQKDIGDYFTINISCPNTSGGEPFLEPENLDKLLLQIEKIRNKKPIFIKLSPDLSEIQVDNLLEVISKYRIEGLICSNLTKARNNVKQKQVPEKGGLSGKVVEEASNKLLKHLYQKIQGKYVLIGLGGVFDAEDAYKKIKLGANLVQIVTGMIYQGPQTIGEINRGLVKLLKKDGFVNVSEAIGTDNQ